jgi:hypothetical protein
MSADQQTDQPKPVTEALMRCSGFVNLLLAIVPRSLLGEKARCERPETFWDPISGWRWWVSLFRVLTNPSGPNPLCKSSRLTEITFLLDPSAYYVWPHPRIETHGNWRNIDTILAHLIARLRFPKFAPRAIALLDTKACDKNRAEALQASEAEQLWRNQARAAA